MLLVLVGVCARGEVGRACVVAVVLLGAAVALWSVPLVEWRGGPFEAFGAVVFWCLPVGVAVVVGGYPRVVERRRVDAVAAARREQQLDIARDLHDYVAHDVSGIVAQAQAARFVGAVDPGQALVALERIERAGLAALASMDRMVATLHVGDPGRAASREALPGIDRLPELVADFTTPGGTGAILTIAPDLASCDDSSVVPVSREASATVYRVVVEALTNVRRHAPSAGGVEVAVTTTTRLGRPAVAVLVVNHRAPHGDSGRRVDAPGRAGGGGGRGLVGLRARVREAGGELDAGPHGDDGPGGWRVHAVLPAQPSVHPAMPSPIPGTPHEARIG
ncbi:sensor histidine kinase [Embleya hyalina]|uniref:sensor histidine kinase n=1 Tax=Embleya hyalina TaxID=516124 RepID=UPI0035312F36